LNILSHCNTCNTNFAKQLSAEPVNIDDVTAWVAILDEYAKGVPAVKSPQDVVANGFVVLLSTLKVSPVLLMKPVAAAVARTCTLLKLMIFDSAFVTEVVIVTVIEEAVML
jgi:hypothetical protein